MCSAALRDARWASLNFHSCSASGCQAFTDRLLSRLPLTKTSFSRISLFAFFLFVCSEDDIIKHEWAGLGADPGLWAPGGGVGSVSWSGSPAGMLRARWFHRCRFIEEAGDVHSVAEQKDILRPGSPWAWRINRIYQVGSLSNVLSSSHRRISSSFPPRSFPLFSSSLFPYSFFASLSLFYCFTSVKVATCVFPELVTSETFGIIFIELEWNVKSCIRILAFFFYFSWRRGNKHLLSEWFCVCGSWNGDPENIPQNYTQWIFQTFSIFILQQRCRDSSPARLVNVLIIFCVTNSFILSQTLQQACPKHKIFIWIIKVSHEK